MRWGMKCLATSVAIAEFPLYYSSAKLPWQDFIGLLKIKTIWCSFEHKLNSNIYLICCYILCYKKKSR